MKTSIRKAGDAILVSVSGKLDFESAVPLKDHLDRILDLDRSKKDPDATTPRFIFNFKDLEFVGSSGISSFITALKEFNTKAPRRPRYCNVGIEFRKMIMALDDDILFDFYESEERALESFDN